MALTIVEAGRTVVGGVDTHLDVHVAAALDPIGGVLGVESFVAHRSVNQTVLSSSPEGTGPPNHHWHVPTGPGNTNRTVSPSYPSCGLLSAGAPRTAPWGHQSPTMLLTRLGAVRRMLICTMTPVDDCLIRHHIEELRDGSAPPQEGRRIHKKQIPAKTAVRPRKMAVSYHWSVQKRLSG